VTGKNAASNARGHLPATADDECRLRLADDRRRAEDVVVQALFLLPRHARMYVTPVNIAYCRLSLIDILHDSNNNNRWSKNSEERPHR